MCTVRDGPPGKASGCREPRQKLLRHGVAVKQTSKQAARAHTHTRPRARAGDGRLRFRFERAPVVFI